MRAFTLGFPTCTNREIFHRNRDRFHEQPIVVGDRGLRIADCLVRAGPAAGVQDPPAQDRLSRTARPLLRSGWAIQFALNAVATDIPAQKLAVFLQISDKAPPDLDIACVHEMFLLMLRGATAHGQSDAQFAKT